MTTRRLVFVDWMKCLGMIAIVLGHTGAQTLADPTPPFNFKQLGVVFFVFVTGYSLAGETRATWRVLYNRLFEVLLFGLLFALVMSAVTWLISGDFAESNYLPLALGSNVLFNNFPANPTTWYIGTYLHLLLLWAIVLRGRRIQLWMIALAVALEIVVRAALISTAGNFVAYMALTNWTSILLLGIWQGQQAAEQPPAKRSWPLLALDVAMLLALLLVWPRLIRAGGLADGFPFSRLTITDGWLVTSAAISFLYIAYAALICRLARTVPASSVATFFANNTLIVFIVHMPLVYALAPHVYQIVPPGWLRCMVNLAFFFVAPACLSQVIRQAISPQGMRDWLLMRLESRWARWTWNSSDKAVEQGCQSN
jgi:peptidoglycan/LPS O-acetylase OafA/YrhL